MAERFFGQDLAYCLAILSLLYGGFVCVGEKLRGSAVAFLNGTQHPIENQRVFLVFHWISVTKVRGDSIDKR